MAPANGSEHFAQKGGTIRGARPRQVAHKYSERSTFPAQTKQVAG
jgi:hypothetical protein